MKTILPEVLELKDLLLRPPRMTLAVAESMTCGRIQACIGAFSGASEFFIGGLTAYTLEEKVRHLGVERAAAAAANSVSAAVAEQMARGACALFGGDLAVATTGYAEPSPEWKVDAPFAWWALAHAQPGGGFLVRSGRVEGRGLARVPAQEFVAGRALAELAAYLRDWRARPVG